MNRLDHPCDGKPIAETDCLTCLRRQTDESAARLNRAISALEADLALLHSNEFTSREGAEADYQSTEQGQ